MWVNVSKTFYAIPIQKTVACYISGTQGAHSLILCSRVQEHTNSPHFCLFLICNDNFLQKGTETCQYLLGRCLGGCKHLLIISASRRYSVTGLLQPGTTGGSCPCRWWDGCRVWQRNMNWILSRTRLLLKLMNNVGTEQNISAKTQLSSGSHAPRPPSLFFYEALIFNCFITVGILGELLHAT